MLFYCGKTRKLSRQKCVLRPPLKLYSSSSGFKRKALVAFVSFVYLTGKVHNIHHVVKPKSPARMSWVLAFSLMLFEYVNTQLDGCSVWVWKGNPVWKCISTQQGATQRLTVLQKSMENCAWLLFPLFLLKRISQWFFFFQSLVFDIRPSGIGNPQIFTPKSLQGKGEYNQKLE